MIPEGTSNFDEIADRLNRVGITAADTLERLNDVLRPENRAAIDKTLANLRELTERPEPAAGGARWHAEGGQTARQTGSERASNSVARLADGAGQDLRPATGTGASGR